MCRRDTVLKASLAALLVSMLPAPTRAAAPGQELFELDLKDLLKVEIVTASRVSEPLARSAATTTVITAAELRSMGARTIYDALRHVPGLQVGTAQFGENFIAVRGIRSDWSEKVLVLLDGHLLNDARSGSAAFQFLDRLPVDNIARIEVMRGPGSALYGANAFLGVIHIITRRPAEITATEISASGEFESSDTVAGRYNLLAGGALGPGWHGSVNLNVLDASGAQLHVPADALGRAGEADTQEQAVDVQGRIENASFSLNGRYFSRDAGDQFGVVHVLNGQSTQQVDYAFVDARYHPRPQGDTRLQVHAYLDHQDSDNNYVGLPAGTIPPTSPFFPWNGTGLLGHPLAQETLAGGEVEIEHRGLAGHLFTGGLGYRYEKLHDPRFLANFDPAPLPEVTDVSSYYNWIDAASRSIVSVYAQDLWDLTDDLRATLGARYDHFNDIGKSFNPRLGLSWHARPGVDARIMYGTAFRAPDFFSQHLQNNPTLLGNPDLDPEEIETLEAGLRLQLGAADAAEFTVFRSKLSDLIATPSGSIQYQNLGEVTIPGAELQWQHQFRNRASLTAGYAYARPDYQGNTLGIQAAQHTASLVLDMPLSARSHWHLNGYWQSETDRAPGDTRADMDGYLLLNTAVSLEVASALELSLAVFNLGDSDARAPAAVNTLPDDYPVPGRSYLLSGRYRFD